MLAFDAHDLGRSLSHEGAQCIEGGGRGLYGAEVCADEDVFQLLAERQHAGRTVERSGREAEDRLREREPEALQRCEMGGLLVAGGVEVDAMRGVEKRALGLVAGYTELRGISE